MYKMKIYDVIRNIHSFPYPVNYNGRYQHSSSAIVNKRNSNIHINLLVDFNELIH